MLDPKLLIVSTFVLDNGDNVGLETVRAGQDSSQHTLLTLPIGVPD